MKSNQETIIGDIVEINNDIIKERRELYTDESVGKVKKFFNDLRYKRYRNRLYRLTNKIKDKNIIFRRAHISELLSYILAFYDGKYKSIQYVTLTNSVECNTTSAEIMVGSSREDITNITYYVTIYSNKPYIYIRANVCKSNGIIQTIEYKRDSLAYDVNSLEYATEYTIRKLNKTFQHILYDFLKDYLDRYNETGYTKEVKE